MIKYIGKKYLDSNLYKQITLKKEENYVKIRVVEDKIYKNTPTIKLDNLTISNQIKDLDDYEKIKEIVAYFLRNNVIWKLVQEKDKIIVMSTSNRKLILELDKEYKELVTMIIQKYMNDRLKFIDENDMDKIHIRATYINDDPVKFVFNESSYFIGRDKDTLEDYLVLTILKNGQDIASFDKKFFVSYMQEIIDKCTKEIMYYADYNTNFRTINLRCYYHESYHYISIARNLIDEIDKNILERNYEIREQNNKQLKLEGIK